MAIIKGDTLQNAGDSEPRPEEPWQGAGGEP